MGIKRMDIKEFRNLGYLQEVNRQFFHPLGLALEVIIDDESGNERLGGIWDYRDDPEGMRFGDNDIDIDKTRRIKALQRAKAMQRKLILSYIIQPAWAKENDES